MPKRRFIFTWCLQAEQFYGYTASRVMESNLHYTSSFPLGAPPQGDFFCSEPLPESRPCCGLSVRKSIIDRSSLWDGPHMKWGRLCVKAKAGARCWSGRRGNTSAAGLNILRSVGVSDAVCVCRIREGPRFGNPAFFTDDAFPQSGRGFSGPPR